MNALPAHRQDLFPVLAILVLLAVLVVANRHVFIPPGGAAGAAESGAPLPNTWPKSYPIYPGAAYLGRDTAQGQVNGHWYDKAWFETRDDSTRVVDWYNQRLSAAGYKPISTDNTGYSEKYAFSSSKRAVDMEIFFAAGHPTDISVDFLPPGA